MDLNSLHICYSCSLNRRTLRTHEIPSACCVSSSKGQKRSLIDVIAREWIVENTYRTNYTMIETYEMIQGRDGSKIMDKKFVMRTMTIMIIIMRSMTCSVFSSVSLLISRRRSVINKWSKLQSIAPEIHRHVEIDHSMLRRITNIVESINEISSMIRWTVPSHHNEFDFNLSKIEVLRESLIVTKTDAVRNSYPWYDDVPTLIDEK